MCSNVLELAAGYGALALIRRLFPVLCIAILAVVIGDTCRLNPPPSIASSIFRSKQH